MPTQETIPGKPPLLLTKLHRPPTTPDMLIRTRLLVGLDQGRQRPLTLISAPAGYGKTVLASSWLETCDFPSAWVSLDEHDNNLVGFLSYWIAAVLGIFPEAELVTESMLRAPSTPSVLDLAWGLANDMDGIEQPFILVLDDYHHIHEMAVHRLLNEILRHPPRLLHLVIISRGDPPLMLNKLRAQRQMNEIRINALSFTPDETAVFLNDVMDISIDPRAASSMRDKTEGWVTALRMAALSLRHRKDVEGLLGSLQGDSRYLQDYLASEVVSHQPPDIQDWMLKTSILQRFCAPLCEALCRLEGAAAESNLTGPVFISWLQDAGLFVVPLDGQHEWFRYHHLFQQALQLQLMQKIGAEQLARYHSQVSTWLAQNNLIDEALHHALAAGDHLGAAELVETYWYAEAEAARWHIVESWLARLPVEIKKQRPALLLAEAFIALSRFQMARVQPLIEQAELLLDQTAAPYLLGELNFFKGNLLYWQGQAERSIQTLEEALAQTPDAHTLVKSNIELMLGLARHANGQKASAIRALNARIHTADPSQFFLLGHLISGLAFIHLLSGELAQARQQARRMQMVNEPLGNVTTDAWGWYLRASTHLNTYNLEQACQCFAVAVQQRYTLDRPAIMDAYAGLALVQQLGGQEGEVTQTLDRLLALARELNAPQNLLVAHSCAARLALLRGDQLSAADWARSFEESVEPTGMFFWLEVPAITKARVLIADGTQESLEQACELLARIRQQSDESHFSCQTIEVAVLQPLALQGQGCTDQALAALKEAIALAKPGGWIRPFVELGQPMEDLLNQLKVQDAADRIAIDRILSAFPKGDQTRPLQITPPSSKSYSPGSTPLDSLTKREHQTLRLLATGVSTEEVASEMVVTVSTVRTYAKRIYAKLGVNSRFEAVAKAQKMGLV